MRIFNRRQARTIPLCIFCYHKVGTVLLTKVFRQISKTKNWNFQSLLGRQEQLPRDSDVILIGHSLLDLSALNTPIIGVHCIRDPRDIIVSGYLYHCRTSEKWCTNSDFSQTSPIEFPQVPLSRQHLSEEWKRNYLISLEGKSYQENLLSMPQHDGLLFEMSHYGAWTIDSMKSWNYNRNDILELKFEDLMNDFDSTFRLMFEYLEFSEAEVEMSLEIASRHDLGRKSSREIEKIAHVHSKKTSKWEDYFQAGHKEKFIEMFGNVLLDLGYEENNDW